VLGCLSAFAAEGAAVLLVTHDSRAALLGRQLRMQAGKIVEG
jgi:predicted ABC-type transport system involved in lysophospholipase L1 biosynthesis ATPase subunit